MSDAVHGLNLVVEAADGRREALPVGDDELIAQGARYQHDVVVDEAAKKASFSSLCMTLYCWTHSWIYIFKIYEIIFC